MIRFVCPTCKSLLQSPDQTAGSRTVCPQCGQRLLIPNSMKPKSEIAARLISLTLALAVLSVLGWLIWMFPNATPQPNGNTSQDDEQVANLAQINPLPLVQEVESSHRDVSAPLSSRIPPPPHPPPAAKKRPADPPPALESRPPELPSPIRPAEDTPKKKRPLPSTDKGEADLLGEELVEAAPKKQEELLEKLRQGKGPEYTQALAIAIGQLPDEAKKKARQTLADRLTRFTAKTLLAYLGDENPELRRAAALALGMKDDKEHIGELIDMLEDPEPLVVRAVQAALKSLTGQDAAAKEHAEAEPARNPNAYAHSPPSRSPLPAPEAKPMARDTPVSRAKQQKENGDLPDVSLVPPEETSSAVKAIIKANAIALHSKRASDRIQAAQVLGGLGEAGKPARRLLCAAMLDPVIAVRFAAADALKEIDPKMHFLAVVLADEKVATENDATRVVALLEKIQKLEEDGEPLAPLVAFVAKFAASAGVYNLFTAALTTLTHIGRRDLASYRVIATALNNPDPLIRAIALRGLAHMKHGKLAVPRILILLKLDTPANRIAAMEALATLADQSTEEIIADAITAQRYHHDEAVRRAVEIALNKLENKQSP
jgi:HEAT repeat protein/DNA-directed RNA polymerase subunit RPC12/RpoP